MVCYAVMWCGMECMVCYDISKLCYEILRYITFHVYAVKDEHRLIVSSSKKEGIAL